jgi:hypothetical protein
MNDRYLKGVLTVIAGALIYLCVVLTPLPGVSAQTNSRRPGEPSGPTEVIVVGWRPPADAPVAVTFQQPISVTASTPLRVTAAEPLRITGRVTTEQSGPDDVVIVGWKDRNTSPSANNLISSPLPVKTP